MKKLVFVMVAAFSLMFVSCNTASTSSSSDNTVVEVSGEASSTSKVENPSKLEVKENADVATPEKSTEDASKPDENKK